MKKGFSLAEVLITLGVIGVVAAMTLPVLIQNHKKHIAETRLKKFYSTVNQALRLSESQNGNYMSWDYPSGYDATKEEVEEWYNKYFRNYLKVLKSEVKSIGSVYRMVLYMPDGSLIILRDISSTIFFPEAKYFALSDMKNGEQDIAYIDPALGGTKFFTFSFDKKNGKGIVPYGYGADLDTVINSEGQGCSKNSTGTFNEHAYCARYIMMNGWKIPKDYPLRF